MKCIILLAIVGACFASQQSQEPGWDIGKTYTYQVQGHALSGLRVDQHGGLQLKYKVKLTRQGQNQYYLQPKDFQVVTNCVQECEQVPNRPIPQSLLQYLEAPIQFSMTPQGKVTSIRFDHSIPQWAMNFKKAQMAPFVTNNQYPQQVTRQQQQDQQQSKQQQKEKTVYGECQVQYLYEQYGQQQQHEQQSQYSPQGQQQQQQKQQQPWYQRIASYYNDNDDDSSSSSSSQQDSNENGRRQGQSQNQNQRQRQDQQRQNQREDQNQYNRKNNYNDNDDSSEENNSAQGFFAKLGRKMGMGSGSSESNEVSQEQNGQQRNRNQQNQVHRGHGQQSQESSEEQGQAEKKNCDSSDQKFQFLKMYRVQDCSHTPNFSNSSSSSTQRSINKRQVFTRYYACGQNKNKYNIYHIERREATKEAQEAVQQLTLVDISSSSSAAQTQIRQPSTYSNLAYNFEVQQLKQKPIVEMDRQEYQKQLKSHNGVGHIEVFQDSDYQGQHTTLDVPVGKCLSLPSGWNDAISSVDPQLSCIILWEHRGCSGEAIRLERYAWGTSQLSRVNMDNKATAIQLC